MRRIVKTLAAVFAVVLIVATAVALRIYSYRNTSPNVQADAAVVLGAAVWGRDVSPVFRERINHAINLYQAGRVKKLIFTGGPRRFIGWGSGPRCFTVDRGSARSSLSSSL